MAGRDASAGALGGLLAHRGLMLLAGGGAMAEAAVLLVAVPAAGALAPQVTALAPLAVFHDLRWLYGHGGSWAGSMAGFWALLTALAAARTVLTAALVRLAWPPGLDPPRPAALLRTGAAATLLSIMVLSPLVTLMFGVALLPFSWPLLAALPVLLLLTGLLSHGGAAPGWWRTLPPARAAAWALGDFLMLSVAATVTARLPGPWAVPVAGLAGLFNARAWCGVTAALTVPGPQRRHAHRLARALPVAPLAVIITVALVIGSLRLVFSAAGGGGAHRGTTVSTLRVLPGAGHAARLPVPGAGGPGAADPQGSGQGGGQGGGQMRSPVLEIAGFGSTCCGPSAALRALSPDGIVRQFSYRGMTAAGQPLPYGRAASDLPLPALGDRIASQVWRLHRLTGRPVDIVADSEGTLGVYAMLARHPRVPVGSVVLLSPILAPGQVSYPRSGGQGSGLVPGYELQAVVRFIGSLSPYGASGAQELISSVDRSGARFAGAAVELARHGSVRWLTVLPLADAVTLPACVPPSSTVVVPAWHGSLDGDRAVQQIVREFFAGRAIRAQPGLQQAAETVAAAATAWRLPEVAVPTPPCLPQTK